MTQTVTNVSGNQLPGAFSQGFSPGFFVFGNVTLFMPLPVNCVVAGQQKEPIKKAMELSKIGSLRGIFGE